MQAEMQDLLEQTNEIQESLSRSYAVPDEIDEADLQAGQSSYPSPFRLYIRRSGADMPTRYIELDALSAFDADEEAAYLDAVTTPVEIDTTLLEEHGLVRARPLGLCLLLVVANILDRRVFGIPSNRANLLVPCKPPQGLRNAPYKNCIDFSKSHSSSLSHRACLPLPSMYTGIFDFFSF